MFSYHAHDKTRQERSANEYNQIGSKKCHDEPERIFQVVGRNQEVDSKKKKKATHQGKNDLPYPPKNVWHENSEFTPIKFFADPRLKVGDGQI